MSFIFTFKFYRSFMSNNPFYLNNSFNYFINKNLSRFRSNTPVFTSFFSQSECCFYSKSAVHQNIHTVKGWKVIARTGKKTDDSLDPEQPPKSCEEGTDAILHSTLITNLQSCRTVSEQIEKFTSLTSLTDEDIQKRTQFCHSIAEAFRPYFSKFKVHQFGSSVNGLGFKGCDVDASLQTMFDGQDYLYDIKEAPTLESVIDGSIPADTVARQPPRHMLRFVRRILRSNCPDIREPIFLVKARWPILRFYNTKYNVFCDFSCENLASLRNTKLIRILCLLDNRFAALTKLIKYWGKYGGFVGDIDTFNSYAFSLLVVHFLQQTNPPVLPPLQQIIDKSVYLHNGEVNDDNLLFSDMKNFETSKNTQTIEQLLRDYFFYFLNFDFSTLMIPLTSSITPKHSFSPSSADSTEAFMFSPVAVQDPFRLNFNTTAGASYKNCKKFLNAIIEACKVYQNDTVWNPSSPNWGLTSLFQSSAFDQDVNKEWQKNRTFKVFLPLRSKSDVVRTILEQCLLFEFEEMKTKDSLKFVCRVYNNTWQGRDWIRQKCSQSSLSSPIEIENWISKEVLKSRNETRKQTLFTFTGNCYENEEKNRLEIELSFPESKCLPSVPIFLKEYIPFVYQNMKL